MGAGFKLLWQDVLANNFNSLQVKSIYFWRYLIQICPISYIILVSLLALIAASIEVNIVLKHLAGSNSLMPEIRQGLS